MTNINRRGFLLGSAAAAALAGCATSKVGARALKPGEKRTVAMIGTGIQGRFLRDEFLRQKNVRVVAICDVDKTRREDSAAAVDKYYGDGTTCATYEDFRDVLANPEIDAVCIATPDHWHAYISVEAMKHGKDVYCEKPLTFSIDEAKKVIAAQKKYGRVFQTGSMQRSWRVFHTAASLVRGGVIGDVRYVDANYGKGGEKLGGPSHPVRFFNEPKDAAKEAEGFEKLGEKGWNMWLGPAKWRPYSSQLAPVGVNKFYPMFWRFDDDIGSGYNGDWGAHHLDIAQWGIDMDDSGPYRVIRSDEPYSTNLFHGGRRQFGMRMLFKSKKDGKDIELYHGPFGVWGTVFYGTNSIVAVNRGKIAVWVGFDATAVKPTAEVRQGLQDVSYMKDKIVAESVGKDYGTDAAVKKDNRLDAALDLLEKKFAAEIAKAGLYKSPNQIQNFCECVDSRKPTISPAEVGGRSGTLCLLCNMSYVYDTGFDWDGKKMELVGCNCKGISTKREVYRNGWEIVV
ncbi:MAG: Gfo/Idh/MocA family oxidoreductase [Kiritimatiellae bacterium]|nr:Gfo/Idh/MocA family oxidoreductase [Kiritimatiellia bacterium]